MKIVEVKTTQNVTITYDLAPLRERILAFVLDSLIKSFAVFLLSFIFTVILEVRGDAGLIIFMVFVFPVVTFYTLFFEVVLHGQTPGKKMMKIKVIKLNGKQANFQDYLIRWIFRLIDIYITAGISGSMMILSNRNNQRAGDLLSNTVCVRAESKGGISLKEILRIDSKMNYEPVYPGIRSFHEEDIVLIKSALDRQRKYRNLGHDHAVIDLSERVAKKLELDGVPADRVGFLRTVLKDYIVLTR